MQYEQQKSPGSAKRGMVSQDVIVRLTGSKFCGGRRAFENPTRSKLGPDRAPVAYCSRPRLRDTSPRPSPLRRGEGDHRGRSLFHERCATADVSLSSPGGKGWGEKGLSRQGSPARLRLLRACLENHFRCRSRREEAQIIRAFQHESEPPHVGSYNFKTGSKIRWGSL